MSIKQELVFGHLSVHSNRAITHWSDGERCQNSSCWSLNASQSTRCCSRGSYSTLRVHQLHCVLNKTQIHETLKSVKFLVKAVTQRARQGAFLCLCIAKCMTCSIYFLQYCTFQVTLLGTNMQLDVTLLRNIVVISCFFVCLFVSLYRERILLIIYTVLSKLLSLYGGLDDVFNFTA